MKRDSIKIFAALMVAILFLCIKQGYIFSQISGTSGGGVTSKTHTHNTKDHVGAVTTDQNITTIYSNATPSVTLLIDHTNGNINASGTITVGAISGASTVAASNVFATDVYVMQNIYATGSINATGSVTASAYYGDGSHLTGISSSPSFEAVTAVGATSSHNIEIYGSLTTGTNALSGSEDVKFWGSNGAATPTYFLWNASKAAIRGGWEQGAEWSEANTGLESTAFGAAVTASGLYSVALGGACTASGADASTCIGYNSTASNKGSFTHGSSLTSSGQYSGAIGYNGTASGNYSLLFSTSGSTASGIKSVAIGENVKATNDGAMVIGSGTTGFNYLINNDPDTLCVAFRSDACTFKVGRAGDTTGTYGQTDINGVLTVAGGYTSTGMTVETDGDIYTSGAIGVAVSSTSKKLEASGTVFFHNFGTAGPLLSQFQNVSGEDYAITARSDSTMAYSGALFAFVSSASASGTAVVSVLNGCTDCYMFKGSGDNESTYAVTINQDGDFVTSGTATATGTIRTNTGFNVNGSAGVASECFDGGGTEAHLTITGGIVTAVTAGACP